MKPFRRIIALSALAALAIGSAALAQTWPTTNYRNLLDNPRFDIYQRGVTAVTGIAATATYHADRWAAFSSSASASVTLTNVTSGLPTGFVNAEQVQRAAANAILLPVCLTQEIPTSDITALQGSPVVFSAWLLAGGNFSAASNGITFNLVTGTGSDQGLALSFNGNNWTGQATATNTQAITTTWARYGWTTTLPATATEAAIQICYTPVGTAGSADWFQITGAQLEQGTVPTPFENRPLALETQKVQRYFYQLNEGTASSVVGLCQVVATNTETCVIPLPVAMRTASVASTAITVTVGTFKHNAANTFATWSSPTASTSNATSLTITSTNTATAGQVTTIYGGSAGSGKIAVTEDF